MKSETISGIPKSKLALPISGRDHIQGPIGAPLTLLEYGDYECPYCGAAYPEIKAVQEALGDRLCFAFRNFPLVNSHPHAQHAAEAAEAAGAQGRFWEMHDLLFEHQRQWGDLRNPSPNPEAVFLQFALQLGLDSNKFMQSMRSPETRDRVLADVRRGNPIVKGTPTFVLDGQVLPNLPNLEWFVDYVERQLGTTASKSEK